MIYAIAGLLLVIVVAALAFFLGNPSFWNFVRKRSDEALICFQQNDGWIVDTKPPQDRAAKYVGPFRLRTTDGRTHIIYGLEEGITEREADIIKHLS